MKASLVVFVAAVLWLAVIAFMQWGYHNGPKWLFRCESGEPTFFVVATGLVTLFLAVGVSINAIVEGSKNDT